jgi:hypothetical protein
MQGLKKSMSIVLVTNNVKQASRTSDRTAFLLMGAWWNWPKPDNFSPAPKNNKQPTMSPAASVNWSGAPVRLSVAILYAPAAAVLPIIETWGLNLYYGDFHALKNITLPDPAQNHHGVHRALRLRQIHVAADALTA